MHLGGAKALQFSLVSMVQRVDLVLVFLLRDVQLACQLGSDHLYVCLIVPFHLL